MKHMNVSLSSMIGVLALGIEAYPYSTVPVSQASGSHTKPQNRPLAAPACDLKDLSGKPVKSSDLKGKVRD